MDFPDFDGELYPDGIQVSLENYKDKLLLVDFWYMDCPPCIQSIPYLNELQAKYSNKGLMVLGLNPIDNTKKNRKRLPNFLIYHPIKYPFIFIERSATSNYHIAAYPTVYLIDKSGKIIYSKVGYDQTNNELDSLIQQNL